MSPWQQRSLSPSHRQAVYPQQHQSVSSSLQQRVSTAPPNRGYIAAGKPVYIPAIGRDYTAVANCVPIAATSRVSSPPATWHVSKSWCHDTPTAGGSNKQQSCSARRVAVTAIALFVHSVMITGAPLPACFHVVTASASASAALHFGPSSAKLSARRAAAVAHVGKNLHDSLASSLAVMGHGSFHACSFRSAASPSGVVACGARPYLGHAILCTAISPIASVIPAASDDTSLSTTIYNLFSPREWGVLGASAPASHFRTLRSSSPSAAAGVTSLLFSRERDIQRSSKLPTAAVPLLSRRGTASKTVATSAASLLSSGIPAHAVQTPGLPSSLPQVACAAAIARGAVRTAPGATASARVAAAAASAGATATGQATTICSGKAAAPFNRETIYGLLSSSASAAVVKHPHPRMCTRNRVGLPLSRKRFTAAAAGAAFAPVDCAIVAAGRWVERRARRRLAHIPSLRLTAPIVELQLPQLLVRLPLQALVVQLRYKVPRRLTYTRRSSTNASGSIHTSSKTCNSASCGSGREERSNMHATEVQESASVNNSTRHSTTDTLSMASQDSSSGKVSITGSTSAHPPPFTSYNEAEGSRGLSQEHIGGPRLNNERCDSLFSSSTASPKGGWERRACSSDSLSTTTEDDKSTAGSSTYGESEMRNGYYSRPSEKHSQEKGLLQSYREVAAGRTDTAVDFVKIPSDLETRKHFTMGGDKREAVMTQSTDEAISEGCSNSLREDRLTVVRDNVAALGDGQPIVDTADTASVKLPQHMLTEDVKRAAGRVGQKSGEEPTRWEMKVRNGAAVKEKGGPAITRGTVSDESHTARGVHVVFGVRESAGGAATQFLIAALLEAIATARDVLHAWMAPSIGVDIHPASNTLSFVGEALPLKRRGSSWIMKNLVHLLFPPSSSSLLRLALFPDGFCMLSTAVLSPAALLSHLLLRVSSGWRLRGEKPHQKRLLLQGTLQHRWVEKLLQMLQVQFVTGFNLLHAMQAPPQRASFALLLVGRPLCCPRRMRRCYRKALLQQQRRLYTQQQDRQERELEEQHYKQQQPWRWVPLQGHSVTTQGSPPLTTEDRHQYSNSSISNGASSINSMSTTSVSSSRSSSQSGIRACFRRDLALLALHSGSVGDIDDEENDSVRPGSDTFSVELSFAVTGRSSSGKRDSSSGHTFSSDSSNASPIGRGSEEVNSACTQVETGQLKNGKSGLHLPLMHLLVLPQKVLSSLLSSRHNGHNDVRAAQIPVFGDGHSAMAAVTGAIPTVFFSSHLSDKLLGNSQLYCSAAANGRVQWSGSDAGAAVDLQQVLSLARRRRGTSTWKRQLQQLRKQQPQESRKQQQKQQQEQHTQKSQQQKPQQQQQHLRSSFIPEETVTRNKQIVQRGREQEQQQETPPKQHNHQQLQDGAMRGASSVDEEEPRMRTSAVAGVSCVAAAGSAFAASPVGPPSTTPAALPLPPPEHSPQRVPDTQQHTEQVQMREEALNRDEAASPWSLLLRAGDIRIDIDQLTLRFEVVPPDIATAQS